MPTSVSGNGIKINASYAAVEKILSETASEAVKKANAAVDALKTAAEAVRRHSEKLKKAMEDADVSCQNCFAKYLGNNLSPSLSTCNYEYQMFNTGSRASPN